MGGGGRHKRDRCKGSQSLGEKTWNKSFQVYFCVFNSAFPVSFFEVQGLAGSFEGLRAPELLSPCPAIASLSFLAKTLTGTRQTGPPHSDKALMGVTRHPKSLSFPYSHSSTKTKNILLAHFSLSPHFRVPPSRSTGALLPAGVSPPTFLSVTLALSGSDTLGPINSLLLERSAVVLRVRVNAQVLTAAFRTPSNP